MRSLTLLQVYAAFAVVPSWALTNSTGSSPVVDCKCTPNDPCWPSDHDFAALNNTVSGQLIRGVPPGSVCYKDQPNFDETACEQVLASWFDSTFHAADPISIDWPQFANNSCPPIFPNGTSTGGDPSAGDRGCSIGEYPVYALNATDPKHVQEVLKFVDEKNIRLNIKATGHSLTGRSTAFGSISIWTHHIRGIEHIEDFKSDSCENNQSIPQLAFRVGAGERVVDVIEASAKHNAVVVTGGSRTVGIVGWVTGGGHGYLSSDYGMGVDNILQVTMILPTGELITANDCQHSDLFWAVRGGGGGTFGVITEVVMKGYPTPKMSKHNLTLALTDKNHVNEFWDTMGYIHSQLPDLKKGGMSGYYVVVGPPLTPTWTLQWFFQTYNKPNGTSEELFEPIKQHLDNATAYLEYNSSTTYFDNYFSGWNSTAGTDAVATIGFRGSKLLPADSLTDDVEKVARTLQNITDLGAQPLVGSMAASSDNRELDISLNPAWRDAVVHLIAGAGINPNDAEYRTPAQKKAFQDVTTYEMMPQLKALAPNSGAYFNEADPFEPNWQYEFFGLNYPKLKSIKEKYDPHGILWCQSCVGSENWAQEDTGKLCRAHH